MKAPHSFVYRDKTHEFEKNKGVNMNQQLIFFGDHISRKPRSVDTMQKGLRVMGYYTKTVVYGTIVEWSRVAHWFNRIVLRELMAWYKGYLALNGVQIAYMHRAEHSDKIPT